VLVRRVDGTPDREGKPLDRIALEAEVRFAEARREPRAEDLELAMLLRQPELDAMPVEPRCPVAFAESFGAGPDRMSVSWRVKLSARRSAYALPSRTKYTVLPSRDQVGLDSSSAVWVRRRSAPCQVTM